MNLCMPRPTAFLDGGVPSVYVTILHAVVVRVVIFVGLKSDTAGIHQQLTQDRVRGAGNMRVSAGDQPGALQRATIGDLGFRCRPRVITLDRVQEGFDITAGRAVAQEDLVVEPAGVLECAQPLENRGREL
jgi:hypothetical protein